MAGWRFWNRQGGKLRPKGELHQAPVARRAYLVLGLNLLFVSLFLLDLYHQARQLTGTGGLPAAGLGETVEQASPAHDDGAMDSPDGHEILRRWRPFGGQGDEAVPEVDQLPETSLNLELRGILAGQGGPAGAFALILLPNQGEQVFAVGEMLPGDVRVAAIHEDRVILERRGRYETLKLPRKPLPIIDPDA